MIPVTPEKLEQLIQNAEAEGVSEDKILPLRSRLKELRNVGFAHRKTSQDSAKLRYKEIKKDNGKIIYYSTASTLTKDNCEEDEFKNLEMRSVQDSSQQRNSSVKVVYKYPNNPRDITKSV